MSLVVSIYIHIFLIDPPSKHDLAGRMFISYEWWGVWSRIHLYRRSAEPGSLGYAALQAKQIVFLIKFSL